MPSDTLVSQLRAAGCVFAEEEASEIRRVLDDPAAIAAAVAARSRGRPLEHVLGCARFLDLRVALENGVFVPRRRTEDLVRAAVAAATSQTEVAVDLGCGSGAIAAALSAQLDRVAVHACDVDPVAVRCARLNGAQYGFEVHEGRWWEALPPPLRGRVDLAVAYLPHVPTDQLRTLPPDFRSHEPTRTVDGGSDGLDALRSVLRGLEEWLSPDGTFWTLVAPEQVDSAIAEAGRRRVVVETSGDDVILCVSSASGRTPTRRLPSEGMETDLFAGVAVSDLNRAVRWYDQFFADAESFEPNDTERVWTIAPQRHVSVEHRPEHAGHASVTLFVDDFDARLAAVAQRGIRPHSQETYGNGVRKALYRDPDGNEIGVGGPPAPPQDPSSTLVGVD